MSLRHPGRNECALLYSSMLGEACRGIRLASFQLLPFWRSSDQRSAEPLLLPWVRVPIWVLRLGSMRHS